MKKTFITTLALVCLTLGAYTAKAQKSFIEVNAGYSMYTMDYKVGGTTLSDDINVFNVNLGYSYNIAGDFYFGGTLGYTDLSGDKDDNGVSLYTLTPKLTYFMALGSKMYWTPNVYVTFGYGKTDLGKVAGVDLGDINKLNVRIGLSPFSLDFRLSYSF
ncbi:MAG: outer membrane beta-barrel protein [Bacteroidales bacterium]|nr:outer membrane beta-barrel protein [Bacteroidales bacterium]